MCASLFESSGMIGSTSVRIHDDANWVMDRIEIYFMEIGASVQKRDHFSIKAEVTHPDGFAVRVSAKYYADADCVENNIVDFLRRSGDALLFNILYRQFLAYDLGRGTWPEMFYDGQLCPRITMNASSPLLQPTAFQLDSGGEKRKRADQPDL